jgi:hypothetical protein
LVAFAECIDASAIKHKAVTVTFRTAPPRRATVQDQNLPGRQCEPAASGSRLCDRTVGRDTPRMMR